MEAEKRNQIEHWLRVFTTNHNTFYNDNDLKYAEYWKGQVMGIGKIIDLLKLDIDYKYYLNQLH